MEKVNDPIVKINPILSKWYVEMMFLPKLMELLAITPVQIFSYKIYQYWCLRGCIVGLDHLTCMQKVGSSNLGCYSSNMTLQKDKC